MPRITCKLTSCLLWPGLAIEAWPLPLRWAPLPPSSRWRLPRSMRWRASCEMLRRLGLVPPASPRRSFPVPLLFFFLVMWFARLIVDAYARITWKRS